MVLPITKTQKNQDFSKQVTLIYGRPKVGKSTFCSFYPEALFLQTEPGLNHLEVYAKPIISWEEFLEACKELADGKHKFKTVIIDTVDRLSKLCDDWVCKMKEIEEIGDYKKFGAYHISRDEMCRVLAKLGSLPYGLVMVSHVKEIQVETKTRKYSRSTVDLSPSTGRDILKMVDLLFYMDSDIKEEREIGVIRTKPSIYYDAGDKSRLLPENIEFSLDNPKMAYDKIVACFENNIPKKTG